MRLLARYPGAGRADPWRPYLRLLRMGFTKPPCCHDAGGLLHHRFSFSLTRTRRAAGVFFSAALSVGSPRLAVSQHPALWSPDFPHAETDVSVARPSGPLCEGHYSMPRPSKARPRAISHTVYQGLAYSELTKSLQTRLVVTYWLRNSKVIPLSRAYAQVHGLFHNKARPIVLYGPNDPGAPPIVRTVCACVTTEELASWKSL